MCHKLASSLVTTVEGSPGWVLLRRQTDASLHHQWIFRHIQIGWETCTSCAPTWGTIFCSCGRTWWNRSRISSSGSRLTQPLLFGSLAYGNLFSLSSYGCADSGSRGHHLNIRPLPRSEKKDGPSLLIMQCSFRKKTLRALSSGCLYHGYEQYSRSRFMQN